MVMVSSVGLTTLMFDTLVGNPPGTPAPQSCGTASIMLIQNITSDAVIWVPLDHVQCFSVIVTFLPLNVGGLARLTDGLNVGWVPFANQYIGRYSRYEKSFRLTMLM